MSGAVAGRSYASKVKDKSAADHQVTAEQLLREARERTHEVALQVPRQRIENAAELQDFALKRRSFFESEIRKNSTISRVYLQYAKFEAEIKEFERARSVFERGLTMQPRDPAIYLQYVEMELANKNVNHARNVFDRAVYLLPREDKLWYRYTYVEELLGNVPGAKNIFERWMTFKPPTQAWNSFVNFLTRYEEWELCQEVFERYILVHPDVDCWIKYAKWSLRHLSGKGVAAARDIYTRGSDFFGEEYMEERFYLNFCHFEESQREWDRARVIYKYALDHIPKEKAQSLFSSYTQFEKRHGNREGVEDVIVAKRRFAYEEEVKKSPVNYDAWFDLARLEENAGDHARIRDVYERAIANVPPEEEKRAWRRYIYLYIYYAVWEELVAHDVSRARFVYRVAIQVVPHQKFNFSKLFILAAQLEVRQKDLDAARKILGYGIGVAPKDKLMRETISMNLQLRDFERVRGLYAKWLELNMANPATYQAWAETESLLGEDERARSIFELGVGQEILDTPELLWKAYIDWEIDQANFKNARQLYVRLLERTAHVKVFISAARFEASTGEENNLVRAREIFNQGEKVLQLAGDLAKEERLLLLEAWKSMESELGNSESQRIIAKKMPRRIKKRRPIFSVDGSEAGQEEYFDYLFPEEEASAPNLKLLEMARIWKEQQALKATQHDDESESEESNDEGEAEEGEQGDN